MRIALVLMLMVLAGCAQKPNGLTAAQISQSCGVDGKPFAETWPCVRTGIAPLAADADLKAVYIATGDFVVEQVRAGKMTDAEAKLAMAQAEQRAKSESLARENASAQRSSAALDAFVLGSVMNKPNPFATQPAPVMGSPVFISGPRGNSITCQRTSPTTVFCN